MQRAIFASTVLVTAMWVAIPASADDCEDVGKLGFMLGQIEQQCERYRLTPGGHSVLVKMAAKAAALGPEKCAAKGKAAMLQQMSELFPNLTSLAATNDARAFNQQLCDAVARYLGMISPPGRPLVDPKD